MRDASVSRTSQDFSTFSDSPAYGPQILSVGLEATSPHKEFRNCGDIPQRPVPRHPEQTGFWDRL